MRRLVPAALLAASLLLPGSAHAATRRFALLVGENTGDEGDATLHFAESDAQRLARVLRDFGGFGPEDLVALNDVTAEEMRHSLISLNSRIRETPNATLFVFYSGHADAEALHLRGTRFPVEELRSLVHGSPAAARVLIVDACRSGAVTRVKGGHAAPSFAVDVDDRLAAEGMAILSSSAAGEDSQESDRIGASFFTHFLVSGLLGAADEDSDGRVTLDEAFRYASERTLVATAGTMSGPQHPTYRFELGGQGALVLTEPSRQSDRFGHLKFPAGSWLVQRGSEEGPVIAEIASAGEARRISVPEGKYFVSRRERDYLLEGTFGVSAGSDTPVRTGQMREVAYAQVVRKGGTSTTHTWSAYAMATARSAQLDAGAAAGAEVGGRLDLRPLTLQVGLAMLGGQTSQISKPGPETITTREYAATITALRVFDVDRWSFGIGAAAGAAQLVRYYDRSQWAPPPPGMMPPPPYFSNTSLGVYAGPAAAAEVRMWRALHLRFEANWTAETLQVRADPPSPPIDRLVTSGRVRGGIALGWFF